MSNEYLDKLRGLGFPRKQGQSETRVVREQGALLETTEHWDGRQDATVHPDVVRYGARTHQAGRKRGEVAEVKVLGPKDREERYGDGR